MHWLRSAFHAAHLAVPLPALPTTGSLLLGYALSRALGLPQAVARSAAIQAGSRNSALGAQLALAHFPLQPFTAVPAMVSTCVHSLMTSLLAAAWQEQEPAAQHQQQHQHHHQQHHQQHHEEQQHQGEAPPRSAVAGALAAGVAQALALPSTAAQARARARASAVQARFQLAANVVTPLRRAAAAWLLDPAPAPATVIFDDPPTEDGQPARPRRPANPHAMNIIMVGAECAPYSKTGAPGRCGGAVPHSAPAACLPLARLLDGLLPARPRRALGCLPLRRPACLREPVRREPLQAAWAT